MRCKPYLTLRHKSFTHFHLFVTVFKCPQLLSTCTQIFISEYEKNFKSEEINISQRNIISGKKRKIGKKRYSRNTLRGRRYMQICDNVKHVGQFDIKK